jgi:DNA polymerase III delta prime subunit
VAATFTKAAPKQARLKIGFYGPPGSGKTFTALLVAEGLAKTEGKRVAFVDTERGTDFYAKDVPERKIHPEAFDFDALYTRSLADVSEAVKNLDPATYSVVVIDSISHLWDAAIEAFDGAKTSKNTVKMQDWGTIKRPYKALIRFLLDCPMHVMILGRQKNIFEQDASGDMKKVGVGMRAEGETEYEPHVCVRMEQKRGDTSVYAVFEKDRTGINANRTLPNPSFATFAPMLAIMGDEQAKSEDPDDVALRDSELLRDQDNKNAEKEAKSSALMAEMQAKIVAATTIDALGAIGAELKKSRTLMDPHREVLRVIYMERFKSVAGKAMPEA